MTGEVGCFYMDLTDHDNDPYNWVAYKYNEDTDDFTPLDNFICWDIADQIIHTYDESVVYIFQKTNVNGGVEIQLMPFVQHTLMNSSRF